MTGAVYVGNRPRIRLRLLDQDGEVMPDLIGAEVIQIQFRKPGCTAVVSKTATLEGDGSEGWIYYDCETGFIDRAGLWRYVGYIELNGRPFTGADERGLPLTLRVMPRLSLT